MLREADLGQPTTTSDEPSLIRAEGQAIPANIIQTGLNSAEHDDVLHNRAQDMLAPDQSVVEERNPNLVIARTSAVPCIDLEYRSYGACYCCGRGSHGILGHRG